MTDPSASESLSFEQALAELEQIVTELERGETPLEQTIARFERGVALARRCEDRLNEAERKVAVVLQEGSRIVEKDLETGQTISTRVDPAAPAPTRFSGPPSRAEAPPERFDAPPERFDAPLPPEPPPSEPEPDAPRAPRRAAPPRPAPPPPATPQAQMSLGSAFALKPAHEMDDDDIPF